MATYTGYGVSIVYLIDRHVSLAGNRMSLEVEAHLNTINFIICNLYFT